MNDDERPNKIRTENHFYLELQQKHDGNFATMLTPDERTRWDTFPDFHKKLFTYYSRQEWEIVTSLRRFSDNTVVGKVDGCPVTKADQAVISMQFYQSHRRHCRATLTLDELQQLLYPLREFSSDLLRQPIAESLYLHTTDPDIAAQRDSPGWQEYGVWLQPIPLAWLEKQESDYLRECANVWRSYLSPPAPAPESPPPKTYRLKQSVLNSPGATNRLFVDLFRLYGQEVSDWRDLWKFALSGCEESKQVIGEIGTEKRSTNDADVHAIFRDKARNQVWTETKFRKEFDKRTDKITL